MIQIKETCTGCMACRNICPVGAIGQETDPYGFVMPVVRPEKCIRCGRCEKVCPLLQNSGTDEERCLPLCACAARHREPEVVEKSSSGGAFYALAERVLQRDGIVFGCYYDTRHKTAYLTDTDHMPLERLLTSKYVESYIGDHLKRVKRQLETGREVLFCGTPCQVAGLVSFLGRPYDNLLTVDFTCGAVTAQGTLRDYLDTLEKRYRSRIVRLSFRDKYYGWGQYCFLAEFENGKTYRKTAMSDPYFFCFLRSSMQRLSCHECRFSDRHFSDIILSDFWKCGDFEEAMRSFTRSDDSSSRKTKESRSLPFAAHREKQEQMDRRGLSLVLAMTSKGAAALGESRKDSLLLEDLDIQRASYNLRPRVCPEEKLPEIRADQACAHQEGVTALRRRLLSPQKRLHYAFRQFIMDRPHIAAHFPTIVGHGQLMVPSGNSGKNGAGTNRSSGESGKNSAGMKLSSGESGENSAENCEEKRRSLVEPRKSATGKRNLNL